MRAQSFDSWFISQFFLPLWELLDYSFLPVVKQIYNSWTLKFDSFFEFQNAISDIPHLIMIHAYENQNVTHPLLKNRY